MLLGIFSNRLSPASMSGDLSREGGLGLEYFSWRQDRSLREDESECLARAWMVLSSTGKVSQQFNNVPELTLRS